MKIVFCIDALNKGGAERVISNLANDFSNDNEVTIITTSSTYSHYSINSKVDLYSLDIVVSFMPPQSFRVLLIKRLLKLKVIVSVRNDPKREFASVKYRTFMKLLYKKADGFIFQTEEAKSFFPE